jgi:hypothetical protein
VVRALKWPPLCPRLVYPWIVPCPPFRPIKSNSRERLRLCIDRIGRNQPSGIEKPPFELPDYIVKTGILEMREALNEKEERMGLKGKQRDKIRPKMGKIDIDYQKLHDAFFRWQTKPKMSRHGETYVLPVLIQLILLPLFSFSPLSSLFPASFSNHDW